MDPLAPFTDLQEYRAGWPELTSAYPVVLQEAEALLAAYPDSQQLLGDALLWATHYHRDQTRKSGEPYLLHPLAVARILHQQGMHASTLAAALLHDLLEDTEAESTQLREKFGEEILLLVQGLTKISRLSKEDSPWRSKAATYRKLILAASQGGGEGDARVILIKLADRLHNMRTISALKPARAAEIAQETLEVYAPLARRLGMALMQEELEERSLRLSDPEGYREAEMLRVQALGEQGPGLEEMSERLRLACAQAGLQVELSQRIKSHYSIALKLKRGVLIEDILGLRLIVEADEAECYSALGVVHRCFTPLAGSFDDYVALPRQNLYRSLHTTVLSARGQRVEVQIRTRHMHIAAEHGIAAHWLYKERLQDGGPEATRSFLASVAHAQESAPSLEDAYRSLIADAFTEEICVFTPKGEPRFLPAGACAIDFAYAVHTELGNTLLSARINGRLRSPITSLSPGDVVEIVSGGAEQEPALEWLRHVSTARARYRIRQFHQGVDEKDLSQLGWNALREALRGAGLTPLTEPEALQQELRRAGQSSLEQLTLEIGSDRSRAEKVVRRLVERMARAHPSPAPPADPASPSPRATQLARELGLRVDGSEVVSVRLAGCCHPEPPAPLLGYVSMGYGVTVHREDCRNARALGESRAARLVQVEWEGTRSEPLRTEIKLRVRERPGLLKELAEAIYGTGAEVSQLHLSAGGGVVRGHTVCLVTDQAQSEQLRARLRGLSGTLDPPPPREEEEETERKQSDTE